MIGFCLIVSLFIAVATPVWMEMMEELADHASKTPRSISCWQKTSAIGLATICMT